MLLEKRVTKDKLYSEYLKMINGYLRLTEKELQIVASCLYINDKDDDIFSTENRKQIQQECNISSLNLNNHIAHLKRKGIINDSNGVLSINDKIIPIPINGDIVVAYKLIIQ
jgi:hypothetical protein